MPNIESGSYRAEKEFVKRITGCKEVNETKMLMCEFKNSNDVELTPSKIVVKYAPRVSNFLKTNK